MNKIKKEIYKFKCKNTGEEIIFPVVYVEGNTNMDYTTRKLKNKTLAVIVGMHGSEFYTIDAAMKLLNDLESNRLLINGKLIITTIFNLPAFKENMAFVIPNDNKNPLKLFHGNNHGIYTESMNYYFWNEILKDVDYCIELHSSSMPESITNCIYVPIIGEQITDTISRNMAKVYNVKYIIDTEVKDDNENTGIYSKAVPSILTGAGGNGIFDKYNTQVHYDGIKNIMIYIGMLYNEELKDTEEKIILNYNGPIKSDAEGVWYPLVNTGDMVKKGDKVGEIRNYFGDKIKDVISNNDGIVCIIKRNPSLKIDDSLIEINEIKLQC